MIHIRHHLKIQDNDDVCLMFFFLFIRFVFILLTQIFIVVVFNSPIF